jgi:hypothetical protein
LVDSVPEIEHFLDRRAILWTRLDRKAWGNWWKRWVAIYGGMFLPGTRCKQGNKGRHELAQLAVGRFVILAIPDSRVVPLAGNTGRGFAYECSFEEPSLVPDLSSFSGWDFTQSAYDLAWTMVHTHEDDGWGGPYFSRREWQPIPPSYDS